MLLNPSFLIQFWQKSDAKSIISVKAINTGLLEIQKWKDVTIITNKRRNSTEEIQKLKKSKNITKKIAKFKDIETLAELKQEQNKHLVNFLDNYLSPYPLFTLLLISRP
jgi:hypothetical protein